jgi:predicted SAM-dependent methyltransferase
MKIQLSPRRIIKDAITVWSEAGPEVDIVMDLKALTFRPNTITALYAFHVLDHLFAKEAQHAVKNWFRCLAPNAFIHILNDDFEYLVRAYVGGDITVEIFNELHNHPFQCIRENVTKMMNAAGFKEDEVRVWLSGSPEGMPREHYEFILTARKHG